MPAKRATSGPPKPHTRHPPRAAPRAPLAPAHAHSGPHATAPPRPRARRAGPPITHTSQGQRVDHTRITHGSSCPRAHTAPRPPITSCASRLSVGRVPGGKASHVTTRSARSPASAELRTGPVRSPMTFSLSLSFPFVFSFALSFFLFFWAPGARTTPYTSQHGHHLDLDLDLGPESAAPEHSKALAAAPLSHPGPSLSCA